MSEGDSLSVRMAVTHVAGYADTHRNNTFYGQAVGGSTIEPNNGLSLVERFDTDMALAPTHMTVFIGANDMTNFRDASDPASQPDVWLASLWTYVGKLKARGIKVAVGTLLPQCYPTNPIYNQSFNRRRAIVNAAIRGAVGTKIDDVIDFAADPEIGDDADACNAAYYMDPVHPNTAGQQRMYAVYSVVTDSLITK